MQAVSALTADLDRGCSRDRQLDLTAEGLEPPRKLFRVRSLQPFDDLALGIPGRGPRPQIHIRDVTLVQADEARGQLSCRTGQQDQQARRERIKRAGMAGASTGAPPHLGDDRE